VRAEALGVVALAVHGAGNAPDAGRGKIVSDRRD
jgi:hypothetical protein